MNWIWNVPVYLDVARELELGTRAAFAEWRENVYHWTALDDVAWKSESFVARANEMARRFRAP